jgi:hypothetical protein
MVGGKVIETMNVTVDGKPRVWVNVRGTGGERRSECAIWLAGTFAARCVEPGDQIWWQGDWAFWTPRSLAFQDHRLLRIGCSGIARPTAAVITTGEGDE